MSYEPQPGYQQPQQPWPAGPPVAPKKSGKGKGCLTALLVVVGLVILISIAIAIGASSGDDDTDDDTTGSTSTTSAGVGAAPTTAAPTTTPTSQATAPPPTPPESIVHTGTGQTKTPLFEMPDGDYSVHYKFDGDCFYASSLNATDPNVFGFHDVGSGTGPVEGDTNVYSLEGGEYYIDVITGPSPGCGWTVTLTQQ